MKPFAVAAPVAALLLGAACSHAPQVAQGPSPQVVAQAAQDSAAAARLAQARADSLTRAREAAQVAARTRADSIRDDVRGETTAPVSLTTWGLVGSDSMAVADRLHFALDQYDLSAEDLHKLEIKRQVLVAHPDLVIQIAGNADERGPDEYNLALGLRRASSAQRWLTDHGIAAGRIAIVSWGEERPLNKAQTEVAWAQNRRADFLVTRPAR